MRDLGRALGPYIAGWALGGLVFASICLLSVDLLLNGGIGHPATAIVGVARLGQREPGTILTAFLISLLACLPALWLGRATALLLGHGNGTMIVTTVLASAGAALALVAWMGSWLGV